MISRIVPATLGYMLYQKHKALVARSLLFCASLLSPSSNPSRFILRQQLGSGSASGLIHLRAFCEKFSQPNLLQL
jgi:hypothetical protein